MGKVISYMRRPFQNYNIESRAQKVISQNKPTPAPHHEVEQKGIEQFMKENPAEFQETLQKHEELNSNLKKVFVTSQSRMENAGQPKRQLPLDRSSHESPIFGIVEPVHASTGKVSLVNALRFITDHHADAARCSVNDIVKEYSLPEITVRNILRYCKTFEIYIPDNKQTKAKFAGPSVQRIEVKSRPLKQISSETGSKKEDNT